MKLIIDIPYEAYYTFKCELEKGNPNLNALGEIIANGIPYEPQGEWEDYSVDFYRCPECGYLLNKDCPHCQNKVILPKGGAE